MQEEVMSRSRKYRSAKKRRAIESSLQVDDLTPPEREPLSEWRKRRDRFLQHEEAVESEPPPKFPIHKKSESGAPLWIALKYGTEVGFTFVMDDQELTRFLEPFGCKDPEFVLNLLRQVAKVSHLGPDADQSTIDFYFATIAAIKPRGAIQLMLAAQMAALHPLIMKEANKFAHAEDSVESESKQRTLSGLLRMFRNAATTFQQSREGSVALQQISDSAAGGAILSSAAAAHAEVRMQAPTKPVPEIETPQLAPLSEQLNDNDVIPLESVRQKKNGRRSPT